MSGRRRAILMGNAAYPADDKLPDLACPLNDVDGLAAVLRDPKLGGFEPVETLRDATSAEARRRLVAFLRDAGAEDTVLFYYSGHGKLDRSFALHLCTSDSEVDLLEATGVSIRFVHDLLKKCRAQKSVMLLDCCYSGAAKGLRSRGNVDEQLKFTVQGTGTYLLTASNGIETAQEKEGERYGVFTKHVIEGLRSGEADHDGRGYVTMDDLYDYVVRAVRTDSTQRPNREVDGHGDIIIARSGKDSRKDRAAAAAKLLFARAASGDIDPAIAAAVEQVARKRPSEHSVQDAAIDSALDELLAERLTLGAFVTAYWQARALADRPAAKEPRARPRPEPEPEPEPPDPSPEPAAKAAERPAQPSPWWRTAAKARAPGPILGFAAAAAAEALAGVAARNAKPAQPKAAPKPAPAPAAPAVRGRSALWHSFLTPVLVVVAMIVGIASSLDYYGNPDPATVVGLALLGLAAVGINIRMNRTGMGIVGYLFNALAAAFCLLMLLGGALAA